MNVQIKLAHHVSKGLGVGKCEAVLPTLKQIRNELHKASGQGQGVKLPVPVVVHRLATCSQRILVRKLKITQAAVFSGPGKDAVYCLNIFSTRVAGKIAHQIPSL